jgi:hypothetical protein
MSGRFVVSHTASARPDLERVFLDMLPEDFIFDLAAHTRAEHV